MASPEKLAREMEELYREYRSPMLRIALSVLRDEGRRMRCSWLF